LKSQKPAERRWQILAEGQRPAERRWQILAEGRPKAAGELQKTEEPVLGQNMWAQLQEVSRFASSDQQRR